MLVKFEQVDLSPIWINPDAVDVVGYRREVLEISATHDEVMKVLEEADV